MASNGPKGANLGELAGSQPVGDTRGWVYNPELPEDRQYMDFHFRPDIIREQIQANYEKMSVVGMSHQYQSYSHTSNMKVQFDVYMNRLMLLKEGVQQTTREVRKSGGQGTLEGTSDNLKDASALIEWNRRYLQALLVPAVNYTGMVGSAPPAVILSMPGVCTMRCRLLALGTEFQAFDIAGNIKEIKLRVQFEEAPLARITMQDVIDNGAFRTWGVGEF